MLNDRIPQMKQVAEDLGVYDFDLMLAGDGSGTTADNPCGFACYAYDRRAQEIIVHKGSFNHGTNNFAELMPYVHALWHFQTTQQTDIRFPVRVLVVSDSELTVRQGQRLYSRNANLCLWEAINWFEEHGYEFTWKHVRRNTNPIHTDCDKIAGIMRKKLLDVSLVSC
jgi:ribonuclease HI